MTQSYNPFGQMSDFSNSVGSFGNALTGAGDYGALSATTVGPDTNVTWDELSKLPEYQKYSSLYADTPYKDANFSDYALDWSKFGVDRNMPMGGLTSLIDESVPWRGADYSNAKYGDMSLSGNTLNYKGSPITQLMAYDRDATEAMGAMDPRTQLVLNDAPGWNDPLSNWIQKQGAASANNLFGNLNYRARNGDSSSMMFDPQAYYVSRLGGDAASVLNADPGKVAAAQAGWNNNMSPGAQSQRDDAMFGNSFGNFLGPLAMAASMAFPAIAPFVSGLMAAKSAADGNWLGALTSAAGASGMFGGDFGGGGDLFFDDYGIGSDLASGSRLMDIGAGGYQIPSQLAEAGYENYAPVADANITDIPQDLRSTSSGLSDTYDALNNIAKKASALPEVKTAQGAYAIAKQLRDAGMHESQIQEKLAEIQAQQDEGLAASHEASLRASPSRYRPNAAFGLANFGRI